MFKKSIICLACVGFCLSSAVLAGGENNSIKNNNNAPKNQPTVPSAPPVDSFENPTAPPLDIEVNYIDDSGRVCEILPAVPKFQIGGEFISVEQSKLNEDLKEVLKRGYLRQAIKLLEQGADPNTIVDHGSTPLMIFSKANKPELVKESLELGANPDTVDRLCGDTALTHASRRGYASVVKILLEHGARPDLARGVNGDTPLIAAVKWWNDTLEEHASMSEVEKVVRELLSHGADPNRVNNQGDTALHFAAWHGLLDSVRELVNAKADMNMPNRNGYTAFAIAVTSPWNSSIEPNKTVEFLLERGTDLEARVNGKSMLTLAKNGRKKLIKRAIKDAALHKVLAAEPAPSYNHADHPLILATPAELSDFLPDVVPIDVNNNNNNNNENSNLPAVEPARVPRPDPDLVQVHNNWKELGIPKAFAAIDRDHLYQLGNLALSGQSSIEMDRQTALGWDGPLYHHPGYCEKHKGRNAAVAELHSFLQAFRDNGYADESEFGERLWATRGDHDREQLFHWLIRESETFRRYGYYNPVTQPENDSKFKVYKYRVRCIFELRR